MLLSVRRVATLSTLFFAVVAGEAGSKDRGNEGKKDIGQLPWQAEIRLFRESSPFNEPISPESPLDDNSRLMVESLVRDAGERGAVIAWRAWSVPLYIAGPDTPRHSVQLEQYHINGYKFLDSVPIPIGAKQDAYEDGHLTIWDGSTDCLYDFWQMRTLEGRWYASWGNGIPRLSDGIYPFGASTRGSGFSNLAGVILPHELLGHGEINHALIFSSGVNRGGGPVPPATESDGMKTGLQFIPEGARVRLRSDFDLSGFPAHLQKIGRALMKFGALNGDNSGGGFSLYALNTAAAQNAFGYGTIWPWGSEEYPEIPLEFIRNLEVLRLGPQRTLEIKAISGPCAEYRK
jgi:hypothetical protein